VAVHSTILGPISGHFFSAACSAQADSQQSRQFTALPVAYRTCARSSRSISSGCGVLMALHVCNVHSGSWRRAALPHPQNLSLRSASASAKFVVSATGMSQVSLSLRLLQLADTAIELNDVCQLFVQPMGVGRWSAPFVTGPALSSPRHAAVVHHFESPGRKVTLRCDASGS
jgi:hypothetical protein